MIRDSGCNQIEWVSIESPFIQYLMGRVYSQTKNQEGVKIKRKSRSKIQTKKQTRTLLFFDFLRLHFSLYVTHLERHGDLVFELDGAIVEVWVDHPEEEGDNVVEVLGGGTGEDLGGNRRVVIVSNQEVQQGTDRRVHEALRKVREVGGVTMEVVRSFDLLRALSWHLSCR